MRRSNKEISQASLTEIIADLFGVTRYDIVLDTDNDGDLKVVVVGVTLRHDGTIGPKVMRYDVEARIELDVSFTVMGDNEDVAQEAAEEILEQVVSELEGLEVTISSEHEDPDNDRASTTVAHHEVRDVTEA